MLSARRLVPIVVLTAVIAAACSSAPPDSGGPSASATGAPPTSVRGTAVPSTAAPDDADSAVEAIAADDTLAGRGSPLIDVGHYALDLTWDPAADRLVGRATLSVRAAVALGGDAHPTIDLDLQPFTIDGVTVDGVPADATASDGKLHITAPPIPADGTFTVEVRYAGEPTAVPTAALDGVSVGWLHGADSSIVLAEPDGAHSWYPVNDHPLDKATYDIAVTVPAPLVAVANGRLDRTDTSADGRGHTYHWVMDAPMAGYLASVVTGELDVTGETDEAGVAYSSWLPAGTGSSTSVAALPRVVARIAKHLGPFPFSTYGAVVYDDAFIEDADATTRSFLSHVALEVQGRSMYAQSAFEPTTIVHETAHQWFGDNVSVTDWGQDIWWVEGFATFAEDTFASDGSTQNLLDRAHDRYESRWSRCKGTAADHLDAADLFTGPSYECGSLVFYTLWQEVGDDQLWQILRTFQERHRHANATTQDLIDVASDVAGRDLDGFLRSWLSADRPALP